MMNKEVKADALRSSRAEVVPRQRLSAILGPKAASCWNVINSVPVVGQKRVASSSLALHIVPTVPAVGKKESTSCSLTKKVQLGL